MYKNALCNAESIKNALHLMAHFCAVHKNRPKKTATAAPNEESTFNANDEHFAYAGRSTESKLNEYGLEPENSDREKIHITKTKKHTPKKQQQQKKN